MLHGLTDTGHCNVCHGRPSDLLLENDAGDSSVCKLCCLCLAPLAAAAAAVAVAAGDPTGQYRGLAANMLQVLNHSWVGCGYAPISDVKTGAWPSIAGVGKPARSV
jgi:hypothetical protein